MPERPDLAWVIPQLHGGVVGRSITAIAVLDPVVVRVAVEGTLPDLLLGRRFTAVRRHLHFVRFDLEPSDLTLLVHPMLAGRFRFDIPGARRTRDTCVVWTVEGDVELRYRDDKRMGKVYLARTQGLDRIPGFSPAGVDVLDATAFTVPILAGLLRKRRDQIKLFLLDKGVVDSFGNAYADEALWQAQLHPKRRCSELDADEVQRLHHAMVTTLREATEAVAAAAPPLDHKVRDHVSVRHRKGQPCPRCGTTLRAAGVRGHDAFFCPTCQPDTKSRGFVDWRKAGA